MSKIAISLPDELLQAVEEERQARGESRSKYFQRAVEEHLRRKREREAVEQYIRAYQQYPETGAARALADSTLGYAFDEDSWEEEFNQ